VGSRFSDAVTGKHVLHQNSQEVDVEKLEEEVEFLRRKLAVDAVTTEQLRQEVKSLTGGSLNF
jgi:hypothetical protein